MASAILGLVLDSTVLVAAERAKRTTPEVKGEVTRVSADVVVDQKTNASFYTIRIGFSDEEATKTEC